MTDELIPQDSAKAIIQQVFASMREAITNQVNLTKSQLIQMMTSNLNQAVDEYLDTLKKKIDDIDRNMSSL